MVGESDGAILETDRRESISTYVGEGQGMEMGEGLTMVSRI
jgi:hypothetical protein